jgi:cytoskeletal protein CcmA (bactofilin family)
MSPLSKRRLLDSLGGGAPTLVAEGCRITGDIETPGPLVVGGTIRGDGHVRGALSMAASAEWEGEIRAQRAVVAGKIIGALSVQDKLEIGATAVIRARVSAKSIAIAKGAVIDGEVVVTSGKPIVSFEEKRDPASSTQAEAARSGERGKTG